VIADSNANKLPCVVVMSVWGRKQFTNDCIHSLHENTDYPFKLIVVDDGSSGHGAAVIPMLQQFEKDRLIHKLILMPSHPGTSRMGKDAVNAGLRWVYDHLQQEVGYIAIQDNDFLFTDKKWLSLSVDALNKCAKVRGRNGWNIDVMTLNHRNRDPKEGGAHKTLGTIQMGPYTIDVKADVGGGQYVYRMCHFVGMGGGDNISGMMYRKNENSDWNFFQRHHARGHQCGHIRAINEKLITTRFLQHRGDIHRVWGTAECPT